MSEPTPSPAPYQATDRRPIASRQLRIVQQMTTALVRLGLSANAISVIGMICALIGGVAFAATTWLPDWQRAFWLIAAVMIQLRLLANMLDGMVAIESGTASPVGELYNEVPDRVSDAAVLIGAGYAIGGDVALGYLAACVAVFTAYIRAMGKITVGKQDFCGPMAKQQRMFTMTVVGVFLGLAPLAWHVHVEDHPSWGIPSAGLALIIVVGLFTCIRRLYRIAAQLQAKRSP